MASFERFFGLDVFGFSAKWSPYFIGFLIIILLGYYFWNWKSRTNKVTNKQSALFITSIFVLYLAYGSPIDLLGHLIFSAHMTSMALGLLVAPPLFILGVPAWMWERIIVQPLRKMFSWMMHPILTLVLFNMLFSIYHFPVIHDKIMTIYWLHTLVYVILFITSIMMWWHVTPPDPKYARLTDLRKMGYIFGTGFLLTPACALIIFTGSPMYATYSDPNVWIQALGFCVPGDVNVLLSDLGVGGPEFFSVLPPLHDQQLGGVIMKLVQEGINAALLYYVFTNWYRKERETN